MSKTSLEPRLVPSLLARNIDETLSYYRLLGFELSGSYPDEEAPNWIEVRRDDIVLQFHTGPPGGMPKEPVCSGTLYLFPTDVRAMADELRAKVDFAWGPEVMDYGLREFGIRDPNGYYLAFAGDE